MTLLRNPAGVSEEICGLALPRRGRRVPRRHIESHVHRFFAELPLDHSPRVLDAMMRLDELALRGVRFPSALFLFRKVLFPLDGVLQDVAGNAVRIDQVVAYQFLAHGAKLMPSLWSDYARSLSEVPGGVQPGCGPRWNAGHFLHAPSGSWTGWRST